MSRRKALDHVPQIMEQVCVIGDGNTLYEVIGIGRTRRRVTVRRGTNGADIRVVELRDLTAYQGDA